MSYSLVHKGHMYEAKGYEYHQELRKNETVIRILHVQICTDHQGPAAPVA